MDPTTITATSTAIIGLGTAAAGAFAFFIKRADKRREANEAELIAHLKAELLERDRQLKDVNRLLEQREADGMAWWGQLKAAGIEPVPTAWTPVLKEGI